MCPNASKHPRYQKDWQLNDGPLSKYHLKYWLLETHADAWTLDVTVSLRAHERTSATWSELKGPNTSNQVDGQQGRIVAARSWLQVVWDPPKPVRKFCKSKPQNRSSRTANKKVQQRDRGNLIAIIYFCRSMAIRLETGTDNSKQHSSHALRPLSQISSI